MRGEYPTRRRRGLGAPILPDSWLGWAFSPGTPDATIMATLKQFGASLPPDLQAKWDAAQSTATSSSGAVTASGQPISTQTGAAVTLKNTISVAPGVWNCVMSDGSSHYCDVAGKPISYTPPAPAAAVATPAASSQPTSVVSPSVTPAAQTGVTALPAPVAVTAAGAPISTTTGTPASSTVVAAAQGTLDSLMVWLKGSLIGGVPNWLLLGGAAAALFMFDGGSGARRR
jgi:hypothetical protein